MRQKNHAAGQVKSHPVHPAPWYTKDKRIVLLCARGLWDGRFESEDAAMKACRTALARAGLEGRHTVEAIRDRFRTESRRLRKPPSRAYYTATESRVIDRFARALVRHEYRDATATARVCRKVLARCEHSFPRTRVAVAARIWERALEFGRKPVRVNFTPEERRVLSELAPDVSSGRFREVKDAARAFQARMARKRRAGTGGNKVPARTLESVAVKLKRVATETGLAWGFRDWSSEEDRVVDRFIDLYAKGKFRSFRSASKACRTELRRLDADRLRHPERGRPYDRSLGATQQRLRQRALSRGTKRLLFRRWRGVEQDIAARYVGSYVPGGRPDRQDLAYALQRELRGLGYLRTVKACEGELKRAFKRASEDR
jgi:hypothetical protein